MFVLDDGGRDLRCPKVESAAADDPEYGEQPLGERRSVNSFVWFDGGHGLFVPVVFGHVSPLGVLFSEKFGEAGSDSNFKPEALCFHKLLKISGAGDFLGDGDEFIDDFGRGVNLNRETAPANTSPINVGLLEGGNIWKAHRTVWGHDHNTLEGTVFHLKCGFGYATADGVKVSAE